MKGNPTLSIITLEHSGSSNKQEVDKNNLKKEPSLDSDTCSNLIRLKLEIVVWKVLNNPMIFE